MTIIREIFQNNFKNTQQIIVEFDNDQSSKNDIDIFIMFDNDQRIRKLKKKVVKFRFETKILKLKKRTKRFRFEINATIIVKLFFVTTKNFNASQMKNVKNTSNINNDSMTKSIIIIHKSLKFNKLKI